MTIYTLYVLSNPDWVYEQKNKCGCTTNKYRRLLDSHEQHSYLSKYIVLYDVEVTNEFKLSRLYKEPDRIIFQAGRHKRLIRCIEKLYKIQDPLIQLRQINQYLINEDGSTEFMKEDGIELFKSIIENEFPLLGIKIIKKYNQQEIDEVNEQIENTYNDTFNVKEQIDMLDELISGESNEITIENSSESSNN